MTDWHTVTSPEKSSTFVVTCGYIAEDHNEVTEQAAVVFEHFDQSIIEGPADAVAATLRAAADLLTRPDAQQWHVRPVRTALDLFTVHGAARTELARTNHLVARLLADTLTAQLPDAVYLILDHDDSHNDRLTLDRICDHAGCTLHRFTGDPGADRLPDLPDAHPLRIAWQGHGMDPCDPHTLARVVRDLAADGGVFADELPDDLDSEDAPTEQPCLALTATARVDRPDLADWPRLLRPYR